MNTVNNQFLYPNVSGLPGQMPGASERPKPKTEAPSEFDHVFEKAIEKNAVDLNQIKEPLKFSAHASQRLADRKIVMDAGLMSKINAAVDKAQAKGLEDTLILTSDAAFIVNAKNRTVVTAIDRGSLTGNVFTNIDGAVIV